MCLIACGHTEYNATPKVRACLRGIKTVEKKD